MVKKVLVVDDDEDIVNIVSSLLQSEGYHTVTAINGKDAYDKAVANKPDLIIADIMMPEMDGWEFCWRVRENEALAETPFIFLTARADVMDQIRGSEIGADDYIIKPFRKQELLKRVQNTFDVIDLLRKVKTDGVKPEATPAPKSKGDKSPAKKPSAKKAKPSKKPAAARKATKSKSKPARRSARK